MKNGILEIDVGKLKDLKVEEVVLNDLNVEISFENNITLVVEEYWEYLDEKEQLIDRQLSAKFRKDFKLNRLVGFQLVGFNKIAETFYFVFNNKHLFKISAPNFEFLSLKQYKAFGDGAVDSYRDYFSFGVIKQIDKDLYGNK